MPTQVTFTQPFIFAATVSGTYYHIQVPSIINTQTGIMYGYLDDTLADELISLGLAVAV